MLPTVHVRGCLGPEKTLEWDLYSRSGATNADDCMALIPRGGAVMGEMTVHIDDG